MRKLGLLLVTLFAIPFVVNAAEIDVKTLEATATGSTVSYNGTMDDGSFAVMCSITNSKGEEVKKYSSQVDSNKFEGAFEALPNDTYNVVCANYEGGTLKSVEVVVGESDVESPKTYDAGIIGGITIMGIALLGIVGSVLYIRKHN